MMPTRNSYRLVRACVRAFAVGGKAMSQQNNQSVGIRISFSMLVLRSRPLPIVPCEIKGYINKINMKPKWVQAGPSEYK